MRCPTCETHNDLEQDRCTQCDAAIGYVRERVHLGQQFAFFDASSAEPLLLEVSDGSSSATRQRLTEPTIVSRHMHSLHLGPSGAPRVASMGEQLVRRLRPVPRRPKLPEALSRLHLPELDLVTVVTDRKIYRPEDEVYIVAIGLNYADQEAELEVKLAGQRVYQARVTLDAAGLCLHRYQGLEEGEYQVVLRLPQRPAADTDCSFSCAQFTLSPLIATLESYEFDGDQVHLRLKLEQLNVAYQGPVTLTLRGDQQELASVMVEARDGQVEATLTGPLTWWRVGQLTVELATPEGNTASVALPASSAEEQQRISLSPMDPPVEASASPFRGAEGVIRGLHYRHTRTADTPFELPEVIGSQGRVIARWDVRHAVLMVFDPIAGSHRRLEFHEVAAGDELAFDVDGPYSLFTLGAFMARGEPYEAWGVVIRPVELEARLEAPETALPGQVVVAEVETARPAHCLLLVYDARLEHESPLPKLARRLFRQVRDSRHGLAAQRLAPLAEAPGDQFLSWDDGLDTMVLGAPKTMPMVRSGQMFMMAEGMRGMEVEEAALELVVAMQVAPRESFPELAFIELFPVEGRAERTVRLGDQIGTWRCRAYVFQGYDAVELTQSIQVGAEAFAELDLPAILADGDMVTATARYHTEQPGTLTVTTPSGDFAYDVAGDGVVEFPLTAPGDVVTDLVAGEAADRSRRTVDPPGVETVTASRLMLLQAGETVTGRRVVVYPTVGPLLQTTIDYLVHYPFG